MTLERESDYLRVWRNNLMIDVSQDAQSGTRDFDYNPETQQLLIADETGVSIQRLDSSSDVSRVKVIDPSTGEQVIQSVHHLPNSNGAFLAVVYSSLLRCDPRVSEPCTVFNARTLAKDGPINALSITSDGKRIAAVADKTLFVLDSNLQLLAKTTTSALLTNVAWKSDNGLIGTSSTDRSLTIWRADDLTVVATRSEPDQQRAIVAIVFSDRREGLLYVTNRRGEFGNEGVANGQIWNWLTGTTIRIPFGQFQSSASSVALSRDGRLLAIGGSGDPFVHTFWIAAEDLVNEAKSRLAQSR
jgi:WD40 repeat protein